MDKYQDFYNTLKNRTINPNTDIMWDSIVITASNDSQAESFLKQIENRKNNNYYNRLHAFKHHFQRYF